LVLAALAAGLYYSNKQKSAEAAKPPQPIKRRKSSHSPKPDITKISLKKKGGDELLSKEQRR